jgi:hypothetical protein
MQRKALLAAGLMPVVLLATACAGSTSSTTPQPKPTSASSSTAARDPYRATVAAQWPAIDSAYTAAACAKVDSHGMPADPAVCKADTLAFKALAVKLSADLMGQTPPAALAGADADLKTSLTDLTSRLDESNQAIDKGDAAAFAQAGGLIADAYHAALTAKVAILK